MRTAIAASAAARGTTSPNPPVGAVILDAEGRTAGVGATQPPGGPHAEVMAVRAAGGAAKGGTAIVTLEPCAHTGRTPACTDLLKSVGVAEVYFAVADPNPVAAGGRQVLAQAGIPAHQGLLAQDVERGPLRAWLHYARTGRPHVTWKYAMTMDGRVAAADGTSRWISGPESRAEVHELRRAVDAIIAGTGTVRVDDPQLTARDGDGALLDRQPLRVVVGLGDLSAGRQGDRRRGRDHPPAHPRTRRGAGHTRRPRRRGRAARRRSDGWQGHSYGLDSSTGRWPTSPRNCWDRGRPRWGTRAWQPSRRRTCGRWKARR